MADLLSILRGTAPAPAAPATTRTLSSPSIATTAPPQLARHDSGASVTSTASPEMNLGRGQGAPNPLEQLLRTFSQPRPASVASSDPSNAVNSAGPQPDNGQQSHVHGQGPLSPTGGTRPSTSDSATLLSLLKGTSPSGIMSPTPAQPVASPLLSPRGGNAKDLLGLLMGGSGPVTPASEAAPTTAAVQQPAQEQPKTEAASQVNDVVDMLGLLGMQNAPSEPIPTESQPAPATSGGPPPPVFTFVSPFDFLESTRSPPPPPQASQQAEASTQASQAEITASEPVPAAAVAPQPQQPARTVSSAATRRPLDLGQGAASPVSVASTSDVSKALDSAAGHDGSSTSFPQTYLASKHLRSVPAPAPSWAPLGVRLPRRASLPYNAPQHLTISTADPHLEALVPAAPHVTPIALFPVPLAERKSLARRRTAGIWDQGIAYGSAGTGKNRVRVIDRESGAKVLLKGKKEEKEIVELQVEGQSFGGMRRIACVGKEGRLSVWQVPDRFDDESSASQQSIRLLNLPSAASPFVLARFVPGQQLLFAVRSDRVIAVYNLANTNAKPKEIRLIGGGEIVDVAFSPDAAYAAVLTSKSIVTFQLDNSSAQKKTDLGDVLGDEAAGEADQIVFVSPANEADTDGDAHARPAGLAVSSTFGTKISFLPIRSQSGRLSLAATPTVQIDITPPPSDVEQFLFSQLEFHEKTQSLVVSHSLRGSLFTFRLAFVDGPDGEPVIRINHVLEHPTPAPILSFTLDSLPTADPNSETKEEHDLPEGVRAASKVRYGALAVHPGGVHHVALVAEQPRYYAETAPKHRSHDSDTSSDGEGMARRMSLEGSIHVSSEVEVTVEEIDIVEVDLSANGVVIEEDGVQTVLITASSVDEPEETPTTAEGTPRHPLTAIPSVQTSPRGAAEPALGDLSNGIAAVATPIAELLREDVLPVPSSAAGTTRETSNLAAADFAERSSAMPRGPMGANNDDLATMIAGVVQRELQKQGGSSQSFDRKLKAMEQRLASSFEAAIQLQTTAAVAATVHQVLPIELARHLAHPDLVFTLSEGVASNVAPILEQTLALRLISTVSPAIERQLSRAVEGVMDSIRQEMLDVRKEIVQEQSGAVSILEDEVANLRAEVSTMKSMLEKMERLLMASAAAAATNNAASPRLGHAPLHAAPGRQPSRQVSQPAPIAFSPPQHSTAGPPPATAIMQTLPPIPRAITPPARYEELFTDVMLPSHEPEFAGLAHLIMASPLARLEAIFPAAPATPLLTMPVVLSLAYRLSQVIANKDGPVDDADKRHLLWLRKAVAACDGKQSPEIVALIPRILTNVVENLVTRGRRLMAMNDQAGAGEVRLVTQYAHARLTLYQQAGAEGPGVETFRR